MIVIYMTLIIVQVDHRTVSGSEILGNANVEAIDERSMTFLSKEIKTRNAKENKYIQCKGRNKVLSVRVNKNHSNIQKRSIANLSNFCENL